MIWNSLDSLVRIGTFQWVTGDPGAENIFRGRPFGRTALHPAPLRSALEVISRRIRIASSSETNRFSVFPQDFAIDSLPWFGRFG